MIPRDELVALDRRAIWRPYTSSEDHETMDPIVVVAAEGATLIDADGRRYLDGSGSWWCNNLGHGHPRLRAALGRQAETLMHCTFAGVTHEPAARLAAELIDVAPKGLARVFFSDDGSTSVEVAMKIAFQYWQQNGRPEKKRFLSLPGAYHGDTFGSMAVSAVDAFSAIFRPLLAPVARVDDPEGEPDFEAMASAIEAMLEAEGDSIAALVVEPIVQGGRGDARPRAVDPEAPPRGHRARRRAPRVRRGLHGLRAHGPHVGLRSRRHHARSPLHGEGPLGRGAPLRGDARDRARVRRLPRRQASRPDARPHVLRQPARRRDRARGPRESTARTRSSTACRAARA